jgi:hypothetical protein
MAGFVLCRCAAEGLVRALPEALRHRRDQRILSWPTVAGVQAWRRQPGKRKFVYTVKVCELISHIQKFQGHEDTRERFRDDRRHSRRPDGCFLFQLPPSYRYTKTRLSDIVSQLDPPHAATSSNSGMPAEEVYDAFRRAGIIFCSCRGPRLPDELIRTTDEVHVRLHGSLCSDDGYDHDRHGRRSRSDRTAIPHQDQKLRYRTQIRPVTTKEKIVVGGRVPADVELESVPTDWGPSLTKYRRPRHVGRSG